MDPLGKNLVRISSSVMYIPFHEGELLFALRRYRFLSPVRESNFPASFLFAHLLGEKFIDSIPFSPPSVVCFLFFFFSHGEERELKNICP